jgi:hypothetical protein
MAQCVHLTEIQNGCPDAGARFKVTLTKNRAGIRGKDASPFTAHLIQDEKARLAWSIGPGSPTDEEILELVDAGMSQAAAAAKIGVHPSTVSRRIKRSRGDDG